MPVLTFQPRFWGAVHSGRKPHTIRPHRKVPLQVGCTLSLRGWSGRPYMSPQVVLGQTRYTGAREIIIELTGPQRLRLDGRIQNRDETEALAVADGFDGWAAMHAWFCTTHRCDRFGQFVGQLHGWETEGPHWQPVAACPEPSAVVV